MRFVILLCLVAVMLFLAAGPLGCSASRVTETYDLTPVHAHSVGEGRTETYRVWRGPDGALWVERFLDKEVRP